MIDRTYIRTMARYNHWQNESLYAAADTLPDEARRQDRGAFFKSIHATLNHLLWADNIWLSRLSDLPEPAVKIAELDVFRRRLGGPETRARRLRQAHPRLGGSPGRRADRRRTRLAFIDIGPRGQPAALARDCSFLQPPNPSPRASPRDAHRRRREAGGYGSHHDAGLASHPPTRALVLSSSRNHHCACVIAGGTQRPSSASGLGA